MSPYVHVTMWPAFYLATDEPGQILGFTRRDDLAGTVRHGTDHGEGCYDVFEIDGTVTRYVASDA